MIDERILRARRLADVAERDYWGTLVDVQAECAHPIVLQSPRSVSGENYRLCLSCLLEERGSSMSFDLGHWRRYDHHDSVLGNKQGREVFQAATPAEYSRRKRP